MLIIIRLSFYLNSKSKSHLQPPQLAAIERTNHIRMTPSPNKYPISETKIRILILKSNQYNHTPSIGIKGWHNQNFSFAEQCLQLSECADVNTHHSTKSLTQPSSVHTLTYPNLPLPVAMWDEDLRIEKSNEY